MLKVLWDLNSDFSLERIQRNIEQNTHAHPKVVQASVR